MWFIPVLYFDFPAVLDGKEINDTEKKFLLSWKEAKEAKKRQKLEDVERHRVSDIYVEDRGNQNGRLKSASIA